MESFLWDEQYWVNRAAEARVMQEHIHDAPCNQIMKDIAATYDQLGRLIKQFKQASVNRPNPKISTPSKRQRARRQPEA